MSVFDRFEFPQVRHLVSKKVNASACGTPARTYAAPTDTPRSSVIGFALLMCVLVQLLSGFFITARVFESSEVQSFVGFVHRAIPLFFVGFWCVHILRGTLSSPVTGSSSLKTGGVVLLFIATVLGTGYTLAASGEAGYWGAVISVLNVISTLADFFFKTAQLLCISAGLLIGLDSDLFFAALAGSTAISPAVFFYFIFFIHLFGGIFLFLVVSAHMGSAHGAGTMVGLTSRNSSRAALFSVVESRDLRFVGIFVGALLATLAGLSWIFRVGNGILLNTETKPPARVATEVYFSGIYAGFRYMPLVSCVFLFVATTAVFWFLITPATTQQTRILLLTAGLFFIFLFSAIGFVPIDLVEHLFINTRNVCLPCWLPVAYADEVRRPFRLVHQSDVADGVGREMYRWLRRYEPEIDIYVIPEEVLPQKIARQADITDLSFLLGEPKPKWRVGEREICAPSFEAYLLCEWRWYNWVNEEYRDPVLFTDYMREQSWCNPPLPKNELYLRADKIYVTPAMHDWVRCSSHFHVRPTRSCADIR